MVELGKLEQVDAPRPSWPHEAHDFTPWLLGESADRLSAALGIDLELEGFKHPVGGDPLDLVGRDITNAAEAGVEASRRGGLA